MKKKLVFMVINMNVGGTEKALLNMIAEIPKERYEITILMLENKGGFLKSVPDYVKVDYLKEYKEFRALINSPPRKAIIQTIKKGEILKALNITFFNIVSRISGEKSSLFKYLLKNIPVYKKEFDVAIAYAGPMDFISYFVKNKINAKKKIQWIHFDITKIGFNQKFAKKTFIDFDRICVVSQEAKSKLVNLVPSVEEKTQVFLNLISPQSIISQASDGKGFQDQYDGVRLLTVGRLSSEKGQDLAIGAMSRLLKEGYKLKWYCVGEGSSRNRYQNLIDKNNLHEDFILVGSDPNPYPYISQCDIYVQPSRYEGFCLTLLEAKCLNKPIITTNVNGVNEQIQHGLTGLVVNINEEELYMSIKKLLENRNLCKELTANLSRESQNSNRIEEKLFRIFG